MRKEVRALGVRVLAFLPPLLSASCIAGISGQYVWPDKRGCLNVPVTPRSVAESQALLNEAVNSGDGGIPSGLRGGVLVDGEVTAQVPGPCNQPAWRVTVSHQYLGAEDGGMRSVDVVSPEPSKGGVRLVVGATYRLYAVQMDGTFYVWNGGVIKM